MRIAVGLHDTVRAQSRLWALFNLPMLYERSGRCQRIAARMLAFANRAQ
jgi:hypothetical protein